MSEVGRPTKYNDQTIPITLDYLNNFKEYGDMVPSVAGLADYLEVCRETLYEWARHEDKSEFSDILKRILTRQEKTLFNGGLSGDFNSNIAKLALGKHGYSDKQELAGKDGGPLEVQFTDVLREINERKRAVDTAS